MRDEYFEITLADFEDFRDHAIAEEDWPMVQYYKDQIANLEEE